MTDHTIDLKTSLNKFKKTEIITCIFSDHSGMKQVMSKSKKMGKFIDMCKLNNTLLNNHWVIEEIKREFKIYLKTNENKNTNFQNL